MLSKEDMALEALIKISAQIISAGISNHFSDSTLEYADEALKANGWEIVSNEFGHAKARKLQATTTQEIK